MTSQHGTSGTVQAFGPVHCISCNITFSSQAHLDAHLPCSNTDFDLSKVKTEVEDPQPADSSTDLCTDITTRLAENSTSLECLPGAMHIKQEIKSEAPDSSTSEPVLSVVLPDSIVVTQRNQKCFRESSRGRRGKIGERSRGRQRQPMDTVSKSITQELSPRGGSFKTRHCNISAKKKTSPTILPKLQANPGGSDIKISGVYYAMPKKNKELLLSSNENPSVVSVPVSAVVNAPSVSQATIAVSNTISLSSMDSHRTFPSVSISQTAISIPSVVPMSSVNAMGAFPILPTQNIINPLPCGSVMLGNNIMSHPQQAPILWGNTTPIFNPLQAINPIQTNSAVIPGLQSINLPQPLQSIPNFALPLNQNILQANSFQAISSAVPSNTETTVNASKTSNSNSSTMILPPNPVSQKVPLLVGNQLIFVDPPSSTPVQTGLLQENNLSVANHQASQPCPQLFQSSSQLSTKPVISFTRQSAPVLITSSSTSQNVHKVVPTAMNSSVQVTSPNNMPLNPENISNNVSTTKSPQKLSAASLPTPKLPLPSQIAVAKLCRKYRGHRRGRPPNVKTVQNTMKRRLLSNVTDSTESKSSSDTETTCLTNQVTKPTCTVTKSLVMSVSAPVSVKHSTLTPTQSAKMANLENKISNLKSTALKHGLGSKSKTSPAVTTQPSWAPTALAAVISSLSTIDAMASSLTKVSTISSAISPAPSPKTSTIPQVTPIVTSVVPTAVSSVTTTTATTSSSVKTSAASEGVSVTSPVKSCLRSTKTITASTTTGVTQQKVPILPAGKVKIAPAPPKKPVTIPILITACTASSVKTSSAPQALVSLGTNKPVAPSPVSSGPSFQNIISPSSITPIIQPPTLLIPPQLQQTQHTALPYVHNFFNLGAPQVPLFSSTIGIPGPNFVMDSNCGQNVWLQNVTNNQATVIGSNNNQQPLLLASPVKSAVVTTQNSNAMISAQQESCLPSLSHFSNTVSITASQAQKDSGKTTIVAPSKNSDDAVKIKREETSETTDTDKERDSAITTESVGKQMNESNTSVTTKRKVDETSLLYSHENKKHKQNEDDNLMSDSSKKVDNEVDKNPMTSLKINLHQTGNNDSSTSQGSSLNKKEKKPLLTEYFDHKTGLLQKQVLSQSRSEDKSDKSIPKPTTELDSLFKSDKTASRNEKGQMFLGPLTKKELEKIMKNPGEIGKYVKVPSGQILIASKALAVPISSAPIKTTSPIEKTLTSQNVLSDAGVVISSVSSLSPFLLNSVSSIASLANTCQISSVCSATVEAKVSYTPIVPKVQTARNVAQISSQRLLAPGSVYMTVSPDDVAKSSVTVHHPGPSQQPRRKKFLSVKRRQELRKQKHQSDLMKLSFIGDIDLLKDSLRKCTVNLQRLPVDIVELSASGHHQEVHNLSRKPAESMDWHNVPKQENNQQHSEDEQSIENIIPHRKERSESSQKQWVPVEMLGDLTIRGRLLDSNAEPEGQGMRRSTRISALPKLDYADLERRPFQDLDDNSDSDFDADEDAFEIVTDIEEEIEEQSITENSSGRQEQSAGDNLNFDDVSSCNSTLNKEQKASVILPSSNTRPTTSSNPGVSKEAVDIFSSSNTENENEPSQPEPSSPIKTPPEPRDCEVEVVNEEKAEALSESTPVHEDKDQEGCHYSSESDSDIYEPSIKFSSKSEKKKYLFRRHSEVTMFLIKHAGKFHSVDDEDAHYCDVCKQYKTNGIFSLAKHLKIHL